MDRIEGRRRKGNTRELRNHLSLGCAQGGHGLHLGEVRGARQGAEVIYRGA